MIKGARNFQQDFRPQLQRSDGKRVACLDERSTPDESRQTTIILRQEETNTSITDRCLCRCLDKLHTSRAEAAFATYRYLPPTQQRPRTSGASCWLCASTSVGIRTCNRETSMPISRVKARCRAKGIIPKHPSSMPLNSYGLRSGLACAKD